MTRSILCSPEFPWHVYIVMCADRTLYTGVARNVEARLHQHNSGTAARYTRSRRPVNLVYQEGCATRGDALRRELEIKRMPRHQKERLAASGREPPEL